MIYKWRRKRRLRRPDIPSLRIGKPAENLVGVVQGRKATDIEERMYKAFLRNGVDENNIDYQPSFIAGRNMSGEIRPDFALYGMGLIQIWYADGDFFHRTAAQRAKDEMNDAILFQRMDGQIEFPIRISGSDLETQQKADAAVRGHL